MNLALLDIQLFERSPPRSFSLNSGGEVSGVHFQNLWLGDRVLADARELELSVEDAKDVRLAP